MTINWWTLALQAINFLVLVWLLWRFLYRPVREVIEKRKALSEEAFAKAAAKEADVDAMKQRIEAERAAMAQERQEMLKSTNAELAAERERTLAQTREEAKKLLDAAKETIAKERQAALGELQAQAGQLSIDLASKLLSEIDANALAAACLEKLEARLRAMPADELETLKRDLAPAAGRMVVVTSVPVPEPDQVRWRERFAAFLGPADKIDFAADAAIVGGAELRLPHTRLKFTWADQLKKAGKVLQGDEAAS